MDQEKQSNLCLSSLDNQHTNNNHHQLCYLQFQQNFRIIAGVSVSLHYLLNKH